MTEAFGHDTLGLMRLAAIDVGSNSVHLLIADVSPEGHVEVVDRVKEMARLGRRSFTTGMLTEEAMDLAVRVLRHFRRLVEMRHVGRICKLRISQRLLWTQALLHHVSSLRVGAYVLVRACGHTMAAAGPWPTDGLFRQRILFRLCCGYVGNI